MTQILIMKQYFTGQNFHVNVCASITQFLYEINRLYKLTSLRLYILWFICISNKTSPRRPYLCIATQEGAKIYTAT